ncbi:MAG TPA: HNH endonuclease [Sedimentisphaerales bacterium]|jgi:hypothetical protein|nr:HNH endonuclease [Sedimentisphaerales bacterium]HNU28305.1 HNH endonuclease [Sedimentisphaerales bacterium]
MTKRQFSVSRVPGAPVSDAELIDDLRRVAETIGQPTVTEREYEELGVYTSSTQISHFGSWNKALVAAQLTTYEKSIPEAELLQDVRRVAQGISRSTVSQKRYRELGHHDLLTLKSRFGSWKDVLTAAGLGVSKHAGMPDEELFENTFRLWEHYGRQPRRRELESPPSTISQGPYWRRFRSWTKALECFVEYANAPDVVAPVPIAANESLDTPSTSESASDSRHVGLSDHAKPTSRESGGSSPRRTPRDPSLRLRFKVLLRDRFRCRQCGASPATNLGVELHVDHVIPWSAGGETTIDNLQTLCKDCNLGKSNLGPGQGGLEVIRAYDAAKASGAEAIPCEQAITEIERSRQ